MCYLERLYSGKRQTIESRQSFLPQESIGTTQNRLAYLLTDSPMLSEELRHRFEQWKPLR